MANIVMILGSTGSGKSTSIKTLNPKETVIINLLKKRLPFKGSTALYNEANKNLFNVEDYNVIVNYLTAMSSNAPHVKNVIIDDLTYVMRKEFMKRAKETGYAKFTELAQHFQQIISTCENMRDDMNVFLIMHSEEVQSDKITTGYKASTIGNLVDSAYNPIEVVPMVLFSAVRYSDKGEATFGFYTHRCKEGTVEIPAKTPDGMFEENFIPNDLGYVVKVMEEYYK